MSTEGEEPSGPVEPTLSAPVEPTREALAPIARIAVGLQHELALVRRTPRGRPGNPARPPAPDRAELEPTGVQRELELLAGRGGAPARTIEASPHEASEMVLALRRELATRAAAQAEMHALLATLEGVLEVRRASQAQLAATLEELRGELRHLSRLADGESAARTAADARAATLEERVGELQRQLAEQAADPEPSSDAAGQVEASRLTEALSRLRDAAPSEPANETAPAAKPARSPWLHKALKRLAEDDAGAAGRLILALLPAQAIVSPDPVCYELALEDAGAIRVTVAAGSTNPTLEYEAAGPGEHVDTRITGTVAGVARLLTAGRVRRRVGRGLARIEGKRDGARSLRALVHAQLRLAELHDAGVRLSPELTWTLAAQMIGARRTAESFTIAHDPGDAGGVPSYMQIRDRKRPTVTSTAPLAPVQTTIACPPGSLLTLLAGHSPGDAVVRGDQRPLELVRQWLELAQSD